VRGIERRRRTDRGWKQREEDVKWKDISPLTPSSENCSDLAENFQHGFL
jgi:hypothetical protein